MFIKEVTYEDFNGNQQTRKYMFNLSKAELLEMQLSIGGGLTEYAKRITEAQDTPALAELFKKLLLMSYGEKSDDGQSFIKKRNGVKLADEFEQTAAYAELYTELATNEQSAIEFINGIIPASVRDEAAQQQIDVVK